MIKAPFNDNQVISLNAYQALTCGHPFTCNCGNLLRATDKGWICTLDDYKQDWAYEHMADWSWVDYNIPHYHTSVTILVSRLCGTDPSSQVCAHTHGRLCVLILMRMIEANSKVDYITLDFSGVRCISHGWARNFFTPLKKYNKFFKVINAEQYVDETINEYWANYTP